MAVLKEYTLSTGATIIIFDDACKDKLGVEMRAALEHFNDTVNDCLHRAALQGRLKPLREGKNSGE